MPDVGIRTDGIRRGRRSVSLVDSHHACTYLFTHTMLTFRAAGSLVSALALAYVLTTVSGIASDASTPVLAANEVTSTTVATAAEGRGHFKKTMMNPYMLIPQLISLGFAPIVLANLKMMVMSALMINNMALNAAIFMTIRNLVFGPRPTVKYINHGYHNPPTDHFEHGHHAQYQDDNGHHDPGQDGRRPSLDEMATWDRRRRKRRTDVVSGR